MSIIVAWLKYTLLGLRRRVLKSSSHHVYFPEVLKLVESSSVACSAIREAVREVLSKYPDLEFGCEQTTEMVGSDRV